MVYVGGDANFHDPVAKKGSGCDLIARDVFDIGSDCGFLSRIRLMPLKGLE